ncbi:hypothetical protein E4U50_001987 [Claviceps purpurea]|nr:hypothetical protein E4U50_001987 [Claviceps purpurea]
MGTGNNRTITKTRRKTRDVDQIKADLLCARHLEQFKDSKRPEDLPGLGQNYCIECAKWFDTETTLKAHKRGKPHKRSFVKSPIQTLAEFRVRKRPLNQSANVTTRKVPMSPIWN